jgi:protein-serine/threonine kinase
MLEMKRGRSIPPEKLDALLCEDHTPLERQPPRVFMNEPPSPPDSPERGGRPSKFRRHGSKLASVLRSLTNSGKRNNPARHLGIKG